MFLSDFQQWLMGQGNGQPGTQAPDQTANVAAPTLNQQLQQAQMGQMMGHLGQFGVTLMAASQRMTPKERAAIMANGAQYLDTSNDGLNAARELATTMSLQQTQREQQRKDELTAMFNSPDMLKKMGVTAEQAKVLGPEGLQKVYETTLSRDPIAQKKALLEMQKLQNEVSNYRDPVQLEFEKTAAEEKAKSGQRERDSKVIFDKELKPSFERLKQQYRDAIKGNAISPIQGNSWWRGTLGAGSAAEGFRQRYEQEREDWVANQVRYKMAKQGTITEGERDRIQNQAPKLDSVDPEEALKLFERIYDTEDGPSETAKNNTGGAKIIRRIR